MNRLPYPFFPLLAAAAVAFLPACSPAPDSPPSPDGAPAPLEVAVSIPPQADFVRRIAGDKAKVQVFVGPGQDPHHFSVTPRQVMDLARAQAYFTTGMPFEEALVSKLKDSQPNLRIVQTIDPKALTENEQEHAHGHEEPPSESPAPPEAASHDEHEDGHDHHHDFDPHVWLSPPLIVEQANAIHAALVALDPDNQSTYDANLADFTFELDALDHELRQILAPHQGKAFFVYHPAFTHFADAYGLEQKSVETGGKSPSPKQLMALVQEAKDHDVKIIFVQPQIDSSSAQTIADAIGGEVVTIDPLAEDVLTNLESIAQTLANSFDK